MRRIILSTFIFACLPVIAHAQNYIPSRGYNGAGVMVNMDVLNTPAPSGNMPVMSQNLPPVEPPIMLRPPVPQAIQQVAPQPMAQIAPPASIPIMPAYTPPAPMGLSNSGRQSLGSLHDAPIDDTSSSMPSPAPQMVAPGTLTDEMSPGSLPSVPPALPSPIMGSTQALSPTAPVASAPGTVMTSDNFEAYRLFFDPSSNELKPSEIAVLNKVATKLSVNPTMRLQVRSYANGTPDNAGAARRLSLTRALKVRDYLMQKNIAATRLDIRALGSGSAEMGDQVGSGNAPADRVDVVFSK